MIYTVSAAFYKVNAFWQAGIQHLWSVWHYFQGTIPTLHPTYSFIWPSRKQHSTPNPHRERVLLPGITDYDVPKGQDISNTHREYWCRTVGHVLEVLMQEANYSRQAHAHIMSFFTESVAPVLGPTDGPSFKRWKSFMTDDHSPIELSWDWRGPADEPIIRFSIEPISLNGGTSVDPMNTVGPETFKHMILGAFPKLDMTWFDHFDSFLNRRTTEFSTQESHLSRIFWGFDLNGVCITAKAYFFPGPLARTMGTSNLSIISQAIAGAPYSTPDKLQALDKLSSFADSLGPDALEFDMLAIDIVDPLESRFKLYFRNRHTGFSSVRDTITLKGQKPGAHLEKGLRSLKQLWCSIFGLLDVSEDAELQLNEHRTAGILYNAEFRLGSSYPDVKIYIPVRHYSSSDQHVIDKVGEFVNHQRQGVHLCGESASVVPSSAYAEAMKRIL
jgi:DMATS type aromatic prenyltransferase